METVCHFSVGTADSPTATLPICPLCSMMCIVTRAGGAPLRRAKSPLRGIRGMEVHGRPSLDRDAGSALLFPSPSTPCFRRFHMRSYTSSWMQPTCSKTVYSSGCVSPAFIHATSCYPGRMGSTAQASVNTMFFCLPHRWSELREKSFKKPRLLQLQPAGGDSQSVVRFTRLASMDGLQPFSHYP